MAYETWKELRDRLVAAHPDVSPETLEHIRRLTARRRHEARVCSIVRGVTEHVRDVLGLDDSAPTPYGVCALLCAAEYHGVHGRTGQATERLQPFCWYGKGRRQALDGPAWTAAIGQAVRHFLDLVGGHHTRWVPVPTAGVAGEVVDADGNVRESCMMSLFLTPGQELVLAQEEIARDPVAWVACVDYLLRRCPKQDNQDG